MAASAFWHLAFPAYCRAQACLGVEKPFPLWQGQICPQAGSLPSQPLNCCWDLGQHKTISRQNKHCFARLFFSPSSFLALNSIIFLKGFLNPISGSPHPIVCICLQQRPLCLRVTESESSSTTCICVLNHPVSGLSKVITGVELTSVRYIFTKCPSCSRHCEGY